MKGRCIAWTMKSMERSNLDSCKEKVSPSVILPGYQITRLPNYRGLTAWDLLPFPPLLPSLLCF